MGEHAQLRIVGTVTVWQLAASLVYYSIFAATPFFRAEFGLSRFLVGLVITAVTIGYAIVLLPFGALVDRFGERRILTLGLLGLAVGAAGVAQSWSYLMLCLVVVFLGAMYGTAMPGTNKAIFDRIVEDRLNIAMGIKQVGVTAGSGLSAVLITWLAAQFVWEVGFYVVAAIALLIAIGFFMLYPAVSTSGTTTYPDFQSLSRNPPFRSLVLAGFFIGGSLFTTTAYTILYVFETTTATYAFGGAVLALVQVTGSVGRIGGGWLCDVLPGNLRRRTGAVLLIQVLAGSLSFGLVILAGSPVFAAVAFGLLGTFVLGNTGVYYSCLGALVQEDDIGGATGGGQLSLTLGGLVMPPVFGLAVDHIGYWAGWSILAIGGLLAAVLVGRVIMTPAPIERTANEASG